MAVSFEDLEEEEAEATLLNSCASIASLRGQKRKGTNISHDRMCQGTFVPCNRRTGCKCGYTDQTKLPETHWHSAEVWSGVGRGVSCRVYLKIIYIYISHTSLYQALVTAPFMYDVMRQAHNRNALDGAAQPGEGSTAGMAMLRGGLQFFFF